MSVAADTGALVLRATVGGYMAAHGAQKLFGVLDGPGMQGTAGFMEMIGLRPGQYWAGAAAAGEFGGGVLTALGFLNPLGPIGIVSAMAMATQKAHIGKGIFASTGGPELTLTTIAAAVALAMGGPGTVSLDRAFGLRLPRWLTAAVAVGATATVVYGMMQSPTPPPADAAQAAAEGHDVAIGVENA